MHFALIMAGGTGTRLWPMSRYNFPKQLLKLDGKRSMFEHAADRLTPLFAPDEIFIIAREELNRRLAELEPAIPAANYITEPAGRGTAPAIGLAAVHLHQRAPHAVMVVLCADHFIADAARFRSALAVGIGQAQAGHLVTLGVTPTSPATGYGYIHQGELLTVEAGFPVYRVERFTEKPDLTTAMRMVASGEYAWNSGMFIWRVDRILEEFERQMPAFHAQLMEIESALGTAEYEPALARVWPDVQKQMIDYGVMEGAKDVVMIPADIGWSDVGSWTSMFDVLPVTADGNAVVGEHVAIDTRNTLVMGSGKRLIATIGVEDMVIVDTEDALLVCPKDREQDVRTIVKMLEDAGKTDKI